MDLNKNDGSFSPSIKGIESGKTSQVDGMNGILQELVNNDNYLNDNKIGNEKKSSVINSSSEDTVATSKAVKTAHDKGVEGLDKANDVSVVANNSMDFVNDNNGLPRNLNIKDIQDVGSKDKNHCYGDRNMPNTLWKIKDSYGRTSTTTQVNDASIFERYDNKELLGKLQNLDIIKSGVYTNATTSDGSIVGVILNFNRPVEYASCVHQGSDPTVSFVIDSNHSNLDTGKVCFKCNYRTTITAGGRYLVILKK